MFSLIESAKECERTGDWDEALARYEEAFRRLGKEGDAPQAAELLRRIGIVHLRRSALDLAEEVYQVSLAISEINSLRGHEAYALNCLAGLAQLRGDVSGARELYGRARSRAEELGDLKLTAMLDLNLGSLANRCGEVAEALESYSRALEGYQSLGDQLNAARAHNNMGMAYLDLEECDEAEAHFCQSADLARAAGDFHMSGIVELNRVELCLARGNYDEAGECCARSLATFNRLGAKTSIGEAYRLEGILYRETDRSGEANAHFAMALGLAEVGQDRLLQAETQIEWALLLLQSGRHREGIQYLNGALRLFEELQARRELSDIKRKQERLENLYLPAIKEWSAGIFGHDQAGHAERVAEYSEMLGRAAGLSGWEMTSLRVGGLIHDIGKTLIPIPVDDEYRAVGAVPENNFLHVHTMAGAALLRQLDFPPEVQAIVRHHHEDYAGTGYSDRLAGEGIPLGTRLVAVADAFDALTSPGRSRAPLSRDGALLSMEREAGRKFDPAVLTLLRGIVAEGKQNVRPRSRKLASLELGDHGRRRSTGERRETAAA